MRKNQVLKYFCPLSVCEFYLYYPVVYDVVQSKSGYFDTGFFCPIGLFCRQVSVKIVLFIQGWIRLTG